MHFEMLILGITSSRRVREPVQGICEEIPDEGCTESHSFQFRKLCVSWPVRPGSLVHERNRSSIGRLPQESQLIDDFP